MDVLSIEHNFGKEIETSILQLFTYFCNNLQLGQWHAAKACLKQLHAYKKNFQFNLDQVLIDIVENPELYCIGSCSLESPYHLSVLLYDYLKSNQFISFKNEEQYFDKLLFKFILCSIFNAESDFLLMKNFIEEVSGYMSSNQTTDLSTESFDFIKNLFIENIFKIEHILRLIFKYNSNSEHVFLKVHLAAISTSLEILDQNNSVEQLCNILNLLAIYEFKTDHEKNEQLRIQLENCKYESIALIQRYFKHICVRFNELWSDDLNKLEDNYWLVYSSFLHHSFKQDKVDLLNLFCKINYQVERASTSYDETCPILAIIKKYAGFQKKNVYLWHRLFLYSFSENKLILQCLIDECLLLISRNQYDNLMLILNVKEFLNLRPLILLIGISKIQDLQSAKKFISMICLNCDKGSLTDKIGNLLKTHLDFIAWFLQLKKENRKKDIGFSELIRLLHRKLPLNIISQHIDINTLNNSQMTQILRNTLTDTETGEKTKWVRFVDEVNEKISLVQENCLAIYDGYYCITEIINSIIYCCETFNKKMSSLNAELNNELEEVNRYKRASTSTYLSLRNQDNKSIKSSISLYDFEGEYKKNVTDKLEKVRSIVSQIKPMNYRLELLENIYSLIYLSINDLKDADQESDDDDNEFKTGRRNNDQTLEAETNEELNKNEFFEIDNQNDITSFSQKEDSELSIYGSSSKNELSSHLKEDTANQSLKSNKPDSCYSNESSSSKKQQTSIFFYESNGESEKGRRKKFINIDRRHAGGGGSFLVNDFMCRDILLLVKDLLQPLRSSNRSETLNASETLSVSITSDQEMSKRLAKLQHLINETLWRFQLIKSENFQLEYGCVNSILFESNSFSLLNDNQEALIYELMKTRKRNFSSASSYISESKNSKQTKQSLTESRNRGKTFTSQLSRDENRRSFESQRTLSLILPSPKTNKHTNQTVMKLIASVETLSSLCLKEAKISEANQLIKMYASNKEACDSFEFRQIVFHSVYQKLIEDLQELDSKKSISSSLIQQSLHSMDLVKLCENLLSIDKDNQILQCIILCDILCTAKYNLSLTLDLADYARVKLNTFSSDSDKETDELAKKFNADMKGKLFLFIEGSKFICNHLIQSEDQNLESNNKKCYLTEFLAKFDGIYLDINDSPNRISVETSVEKHQKFNKLMDNLDSWKTKFENFNWSNFSATKQEDHRSYELKQTEIYFSLMSTINELIRINKNEDIISTFFYDPNQFSNKQFSLTTSNESEMNTIEKLIYKTVNDPKQQHTSGQQHQTNKSFNYLLSFHEYCKTLYEYFKEHSALSSASNLFNSCFSILNSSPASLICKLLFEDSIKPHLIESLTRKLNLNLTAIILHNSCPRLKLTSNSLHKRSQLAKKTDSKQMTEHLISKATSSYYENNVYGLKSFYTVLNESELTYCSHKKPDQFLRDLLFKLLKYCKNFNSNSQEDGIRNLTKSQPGHSINLMTAKKMYESAECKSILNESQELQHLNLNFLIDNNQKLSFFINLYNLLCIHAHFYLASLITSSPNADLIDNLPLDELFTSKTEKLLFQQRMCYKVGQMGCVTLYDLKHLVLTRSFKNFNSPGCSIYTTNKRKIQSCSSSTLTSSPSNKSNLSENSNLIQIDARLSETNEPLYKYSYFKLDLDAEPIWAKDYLPSEDICDYRILFALTSCSESDPPICVYNSDEMLKDQLQMQMSLFLEDSVDVDLCEDILYMPGFLIENCYLFIKSDSTNNANLRTDLEKFIRFIIENVGINLKEKLRSLLDLEPEGFSGENLDEHGRRELSFPIEKMSKSNKFSLVIEYPSGLTDSGHSSWYRKEIQKLIKLNEELKEKKLRQRGLKMVRSASQSSELPTDSTSQNLEAVAEEVNVIHMDDMNEMGLLTRQKLNTDCLDYIDKSSPLISQSLSFLFDMNKREDFFRILIDNENNNNDNALNRFIQLYVPLPFMSHLSMQTKLNLITQFLLTNKTEESKIELIINLANHYAMKQEWHLVLSLLNNCTQDNEELNDLDDAFSHKNSISKHSGTLINNDFDFYDVESKESDKSSEQTSQSRDSDNNGRFSRKDLYNLYDHSCICQAYQEAKTNEKSYIHLYKMKNFLKQTRAIFGLMHLWSVESCLELVEYSLAKCKLFQEPNSFEMDNISQDITTTNHFSISDNFIQVLNEKKNELIAYQELTKYARSTLQKYYEHQQMQDAAGYEPGQTDESSLSKMKKCCQKCLTWQYAKNQLESPNSDEEVNELIMDLFLMNDHFISAKYLIRKLSLSDKLKFKLDFGHLKYRLLNLNVSSSIIVIDLDAILDECVTFKNDCVSTENKAYMFDICFKLLNELKDLRELNNQVLIALSEYLLDNYNKFLSNQQTKELKTLQLTAKIFQVLVQELKESFDSYKRHHSNPLLIIEQLLMNSHTDLCSRAIRFCRDSTLNDQTNNLKINQILVEYAKKALEFKVYSKKESTEAPVEITRNNQSAQGIKISSHHKKNSETIKSSSIAIPLSTSSPNNSNLSSSVRNFSSKTLGNDLLSSSLSTSGSSIKSYSSRFVMPDTPPSKEDWVKDEDVNECMVCNTRRFSLLNRRHHCRRCGRVVCSNCAKNMTLIDNIPRRTCDDCFKQIEQQKAMEKLQADNYEPDSLHWSKKLIKPKTSEKKKSISESENLILNVDEINMNEKRLVWQLMGGYENEASKRRDDEIRNSFRYQQAPSTSLCLSILDLHDQPLECVKDLLNMCDGLSSFLQTANYQVEDFALIISMIKHLLHNAKVKLLQNSSSNMISLCDTYLSLIDVLEQLLLDNCSNIPSLYELKNTETVRRFRNRLLEEERHELAMNLSTKCGLDSQTVWAAWGLAELKRGNFKEARNKFEKCLKPVLDKMSAIGTAQLKILNDTINYLENAPTFQKLGTQSLLSQIQNVRALIAEPKNYLSNQTNMDDAQLNECIYYLETYGNYSLLVLFYQRHGYLEKAFQFIIESKCSPDIFVESLVVPVLKTGEFYQLIDYMLSLERIQNKLLPYYGSIGKHLERNSFLNTLYDFQILMKDYVRASMSCICFFSRYCTNYVDLYNNLNFLNKARIHLEEYLEICSVRQYTQNSQTQVITRQSSLCKQISTQEVDNYLNAINLQIEVTKFINNCIVHKKEQILNQKATCTVFGSNDTKINLCCSILLSGQSIQEGFGFVIRIIQCFNLNATLVYAQIARELAKQYNFKEIHNLLKCINESGYKDEIDASYDECISTCIRVFAAAENNNTTLNNNNNSSSSASQAQQQQQQYSKEIEELIKLIKNDENRINAYILNGRLRSAYLIAIKSERVDIVKHIANAADRAGQLLIKEICNKWLEKKQSQQTN